MRERQKRAAARHGPEAEKIVKRMRSIHARGGHNLSRIWDDWISSMALAIANRVDRRSEVWQRREDEYMQIVARHDRETMQAFAEMMPLVIQAMDSDTPTDVLGGMFMALELGSDHAGQFFTPSSLCDVMAKLLLTPEELLEQVELNGFVSLQEPAIGGGAMVIPVVTALYEAGLNPLEHLHVTGVDVDWTVLRMAYVQLSLLGVPARLYLGDSLRLELREVWYTPAHVAFGWEHRLRRGEAEPVVEAVARARELVEAASAEDIEPSRPPAQGRLFEGW